MIAKKASSSTNRTIPNWCYCHNRISHSIKYIFKYFLKTGKTIKEKKTFERINKLRIPPAYKSVKIYSPSSKIQYTALDDKGRIQKGYHPIWIVERNRKKFRDLIDFTKYYPKIIRKVNKLLPSSSYPKTKEQLIALAVGLLDMCRIRPGSDKHLRDTGSYGTTTLLKKHVKKSNGKIHLKFKGKSGVVNECILNYSSKLGRNVYAIAQKQKSAKDSIFETNNFKITGTDINNFLQDIGGKYISGKSFRTYHANLAFIKKTLPILKTRSSETQRKKDVIEIIKKAAEELHHNPATFRNSYLFTPIKDLYIEDPSKFKKTFNKKDINKALSKFIRGNTKRYAEIPKNWK